MKIGDLIYIRDNMSIHNINGQVGIIQSIPNRWKQYKVFVVSLNRAVFLTPAVMEKL